MMTPSWTQMWASFLRIGLMSFGGPAAQIAVMHKELVEDRAWLDENQFLRALSFCMLLPGPEAMQLATFAGWRLRGVPGGVLAGLLFVVPGAVVMLALATAYVYWGNLAVTQILFLGVKACVVVIVVQALVRLARKALVSADRWAVAGLSFAGIFALNIPFPAIVLAAALYGFATAARSGKAATAALPAARPIRTVALWGALWWVPVLALWLSGAGFLTEIALFFSKLAVVTFGGAYAVLAYMTQAMVQDYGWITTGQMMDGLGLAETTPGPLILVTEFVAFVAGFTAQGSGLALAAAITALWVTFVPCFLWIFLGAPYLEWINTRPMLARALSAITAAIVGVMLNLSLWFALNVFFDGRFLLEWGPIQLLLPQPGSVNWLVVGLAALASVLLLVRRWNLVVVLGLVPLLGLALQAVL